MRIGATAVLFLLAGAAAASAAELRGTVALVTKGGKALARAADLTSALVLYRPQQGAAAPAPRGFTMTTRNKQFEPRVLAVPLGSRVSFPNQDPILHNVFSVSGENRFDLGLYKQGPGKSWTFRHPGIVRVFCNVHQAMVAYIYVLDTPHFAQPDSSGAFVLADLPPGSGTLEVWHEQTEGTTRAVGLPAAARLDLALEVTRPRVPSHLNKLGKPYGRRDYDD